MSAEPRTIERPAADPGLWAWVKSPWATLCLIGGLLYWLIGGLLVSHICWLLYLILPRGKGRLAGRRIIRACFGGFVRYLGWTRLVHIDLSSLDRLRAARESMILAPNHTSLWDAVFLLKLLPSPLCIMKPAILRNPLLNGAARLAGHVPNSSRAGMIHSAVEALQEGGQLILFPEGTRTQPDRRWINPFKGGIALIARRAGVPVYPVFIRSNTRYMEKGWPPWKRPDFPIHISFELGDPLCIQPGETPQQFVARLERLFERELSRPHPLRRQSKSDLSRGAA